MTHPHSTPADESRELDLTSRWANTPGSYSLPGSCSNCGWIGTLKLSKGYEAPRGRRKACCPNCGCKAVSAHA